MIRKYLSLSLACSAMVGSMMASFSTAHANESALPDEPIRFVTPYPAGGSHSLHAGIITAVGEQFMGQPLVSVIRGGGGGAVAAAEVARSTPNGTMLLFGDPTINSLRPQVEQLPYKAEDFVAVARINYSPAIFVTSPDQPFESIGEFVDYAKANPDDVVYSSDNRNGFTYTVFEMLKATADVNMRGVELGGGGPAVTQLLGGNTMAYAGDPSVVGEHLEAGTLVGLCVTDTVRFPQYEDIPTCQEEGYDVVFQFWRGVMAPAGTPDAVVAELSDGFRRMTEDEGFLRLIGKIGSGIQFLGHEEFAEALNKEQAAMRAAYLGE
ncbi:tripartite tricarboxylate transporter substrate binding protein [Marinobacter zhejiangensis]|uniref:Tripartite-type tricarboxylate transporter, receptor component TctC n=1 Tax=Marinobacter zhejiangensis TaxID=488535 RepID=A0A1I4NTL6_9GAMM|nr:tripartite tricarboxylate transporter substrate binding protein [Marinobacter zhejiangensis]SFM18841.1 Tripartite-type tricarboxylate transporter, receptor component TctC [Marinobacter zhejiangensis]